MLLLPWAAGVAGQKVEDEVTVAAAADLTSVLPDIAVQFERATGTKIRLVFASSGSLSAQIRNGAPFDVFLSADREYPRDLIRDGFASGPEAVYATGRLALWVPKASPLPIENEGLRALLSGSVARLAIANPQHAPYGRAAVTLLEDQGIYDKLAGKLVMGENVAQAMQFVASGNAQAGMVSLSLALTPNAQKTGRYILLPSEFPQAGVVLKNAHNAKTGQEFVHFLRSPAGQQSLRLRGLAVGNEQ